jgi:hypothetical protein
MHLADIGKWLSELGQLIALTPGPEMAKKAGLRT